MNLKADFVYPSNFTDSFYQKLEEIDPMPGPLSGLGWNAEYNDTTMPVKAVYAGPESEGREAIEFLLQLGPILQQNITEVPWHQVIQSSFFGAALCQRYYQEVYLISCIQHHAKLVEQFEEMITKYPQTIGSGLALYFPTTQAARAVPSNATAYAWR
ncbi:FAD-binding domain-containing protein [Lasiodiplodia theobromae]|nr:FAD-binding domain-containing protein [Lasiodiplodia theobromae]